MRVNPTWRSRLAQVAVTAGLALLSALAFQVAAAQAAPPLTRAQALQALESPQVMQRLVGAIRLGEIGHAADADRLIERLSDADPRVRSFAVAAVWQVWSRSGNTTIDKLFARGVAQLQGGALTDARDTFSQIVQRKPEFAEAWNKRATVHFLLGDNQKSLDDCAEVLKRNRHHFGALSGIGQIQLKLGQPEQALIAFKQALEVNPNLEGLSEVIEQLESHVRAKERNTT